MGIINITFEVKKIIFRNTESRYTIANCKIKKHDSGKLNEIIPIKGYFPNIFVGDIYSGLAEKLEDNTRGYYLNLLDIPSIVIPENELALSDFISKRVVGLSKKKALEIIDILGINVISLIKDDYTPLLKVPKISEKKAKSIKDQLSNNHGFERLALFIQSLPLPVSYAVKIYELYGENSLTSITANPYSICVDNTIPFFIADKIANYFKYENSNPKRINSAILNYLNNKCENNGDLCIKKDDLLINLNNYLNIIGEIKGPSIKIENIEKEIKSLLTNKSIIIEQNKELDDLMYLPINNNTENGIISHLIKIIGTELTPFCKKEEIKDYINCYEKKYFALDEKQKKSVYMSLLNKISILTGGPGTGKTATTNAIVHCIKQIKPLSKIVLLAPTGRASQRMKELTSMKASTIHKGLNINPFKADVFEEIDADFIIIDESSMIDAYLFFKLIASISEKTRVLLVGDVNQLPSVGPGLILKDLIDSKKIPVTTLETIFRQARTSVIVTNAHKIVNGLTTTDINGVDVSNKISNNFKFWEESNPTKLRNNILLSIDRLIDKYGYDINNISVLSAMRKGDLGTIELNRMIQDKYNPICSGKTDFEIDSINHFREGDRVIQTKNNYDLKVFNGDIGIIKSIYIKIEDGIEVYKMEVEFPQIEVLYSQVDFEELELAYAITIHKSQGSEFDAIIIPIHKMQSNMLYRNLIYTAITRAKKMCILIGEKNSLNSSIKKTSPTVRYSLIKEKLDKLIIHDVA